MAAQASCSPTGDDHQLHAQARVPLPRPAGLVALALRGLAGARCKLTAFFTARDGRLAEARVLGDVDGLRRQLS
jgi:hypothetical protein